MMTRQRFEFLFDLYKAGGLSIEDWEELRSAFREGAYDESLQKDFMQLLQLDEVHASWTPDLESEMWQQIKKGRSAKIAVQSVIIEKTLTARRQIIRYTALAASLLLGIALAWWFRTSSSHPAVASTILTSDSIHPGGNKAILTLSNGTRFVLDSTKNGRIAQQGSAAIDKSNGALSVSSTKINDSFRGAREEDPDNSANTGPVMMALITTPRGGQYQVILPDGSKVWLNSASSLKFPTTFKGRERLVELTGEGYFEIAKNASMPFRVSVKNMNIQVLGTHFNVMAYSDENTINTTLLQGAVEVSEGGLARRPLPGQQARLNSVTHELTLGQADLQKTIAWKNGLFEFDNTDLSAIMRQLARWYDIEVIYKTTPDKSALGGSISKNLNLEEVLALLEANGINHFKIEGKKVFVLP